MDYNKARWEHKRTVILKRDEYLCQESKRYGKSVQAKVVHHIYPVEYYPELAFIDWNLISLSDSKHNAMHDRNTHEITDLGKYWQNKVKDKFNEWMINRYPPTIN
jgi:5-methylcytosine-specific restriction endonuclease McrA